jgi:hypothetical protein
MYAPNTCYELLAPLLTQDLVNYHFEMGRTPIVVYPEVVRGNPLEAKFCVRYLLNFAGSLGGPKQFPTNDYIVCFSQEIQQHYEFPSRLISIPTSDPNVFNRQGESDQRDVECYYLHKRLRSGVPLKNPPKEHWVRIPTGSDPGSPMTKTELANLLRSSKRLYLYEISTLALDAILCGCPVVVFKDDLETDWVACEQLTTDGIAFSEEPVELKRAEDTVGNALENYLSWFRAIDDQVDSFINETQSIAKTVSSDTPIQLGNHFDLPKGPIDRYMKRLSKRYPNLSKKLMKGAFWRQNK